MFMYLGKNLAANPVLHPIFCLLLDLHPGGDQIDDSDHDKDDEDNNYEGEIGEDTDYDENDDDEDTDHLQARLEWSPSLGAVRYSTVFFFNNFCRSAGSLSLKLVGR